MTTTWSTVVSHRQVNSRGEAVYVPAYWDLGLNGCADVDDGPLQSFAIGSEDMAQWPELLDNLRGSAGDWLHLYERSDGFVMELDDESAKAVREELTNERSES